MEVPGGGVEVLDPLPAQGGVGERFPEDICQGFRVAGRSDEADAVIGYDTSHFGKVGDHHGNACPDVVEEFVGQCIAVVETEVLLDGDSQAGLPCKDPQVVRGKSACESYIIQVEAADQGVEFLFQVATAGDDQLRFRKVVHGQDCMLQSAPFVQRSLVDDHRPAWG